ncbi:hypothetical protein EBBID32_36360 [Sphingobium indicum BiD32]|uniref:Uncharacterized protein n=1 Tax=Sphingobium indicum BiD32 TaxID=1301087 RepID=N1MPX4_9SPHN|nr:hypothetical protein EBBID32_36360 [Sphingobium indicum BiD32]
MDRSYRVASPDIAKACEVIGISCYSSRRPAFPQDVPTAPQDRAIRAPVGTSSLLAIPAQAR